jgi:hypothetical protein
LWFSIFGIVRENVEVGLETKAGENRKWEEF